MIICVGIRCFEYIQQTFPCAREWCRIGFCSSRVISILEFFFKVSSVNLLIKL